MTIKYFDINEIYEYENNPRDNEPAVESVANSIRDFGFLVPVVIDRDGVIAAGHTRVKAARLLGMKKVPCIVADDLTDEQVAAFRLVDNKTAELAGWDFAKLDKELEALRGAGVEMRDYGFDDPDPDASVDDFFDDPEKKTKEPKRIQCEYCGEWFEI